MSDHGFVKRLYIQGHPELVCLCCLTGQLLGAAELDADPQGDTVKQVLHDYEHLIILAIDAELK